MSKGQNVRKSDSQKVKKAPAKPWVIKNAGEEDVDPKTLVKNPNNPKEHTQEQFAILREFIEKEGFLGRVIANKRNRHIIEGEMRTTIAVEDKQPVIPVQWVNLATDAEELRAITLYQPLGELAVINRVKMGHNYAEIKNDIGYLADLFLSQELPSLYTMGEQMRDEGRSLFADDGYDDGYFDDDSDDSYGDDDDIFNVDAPPPGGKKGKMPTVILSGDLSQEFRSLLKKAGKLEEVGSQTRLILILGN